MMKRCLTPLACLCVVTMCYAAEGRFGVSLTEEQREALKQEIAERGDLDLTFSNALLYKGLGLFTEKEYEACIPYLEEAISLDPSLRSAWEGLGWAYWRIGEEAEALALWERFLQISPKDVMPYNLLAQAATMQERWLDADGYFRKSLTINPDQYDVRLWFSQNLLRLGKNQEAMRIVRALLREDPDRIDIMILLARMLSYLQEYDESADLWRKITEALPDNPDLMLEQANIEMQVGDLQRADELCAQICQLQEEAGETMGDGVKLSTYERALQLRADIADVADMGELSVTRLEQLIGVVQNKKTRATLKVRMATRCRIINERKDDPPYSNSFILNLYDEAIEDDPQDVNHYLNYAGACYMVRDFSKARDLASIVLERFNAHNQPALDLLFNVELASGNYDRAEQVLEAKYNEFDPTNPLRLYERARVLMMRGEYEAALSQLDEMDRLTSRGSVFTLLYHQLCDSDWMPITSSRRLFEHLSSLQREGFTIIPPNKIPEALSSMAKQEAQRIEEEPEDPPIVAQWVDSLRYVFTGERRFGKSKKAVNNDQPSTAESRNGPYKYVAVTFDDGYRNNLSLGTPIAQTFDTAFGFFVITKEPEEFAPAYASWSEIADYADTGYWVVGSHLEEAHELLAVDAEGTKRHALPNRLWTRVKDPTTGELSKTEGRLESMNEWDRRMRRNFRKSRKTLLERVPALAAQAVAEPKSDSPNPRFSIAKSKPTIPLMVAYPFGDVGQQEGCNITAIKNPMQTIISEAARSYTMGFIQTSSGYSCVGGNPMLLGRHEPQWFDEGDDVVRHAYINHPYFMSRRLRVNIAYLQNKPHLAKDMLKDLRDNGYPADLCRELEIETYAHFTQKPTRVEKPLVRQVSYDTMALSAIDASGGRHSTGSRQWAASTASAAYSPDQRAVGLGGSSMAPMDIGERDVQLDGDARPWIAFNSPYIGFDLTDAKANGDFTYNSYGFSGGFNINMRSAFSLEYHTGVIKQKTTLTTDNPLYDPGAPSTATSNQVYIARNAQYRATKDDFRVRYSYRFDSGAVFAASFGSSSISVDQEKSSNFYLDRNNKTDPFQPRPAIEDGGTMVGGLSYTFYPNETTMFSAYYLHDVVSTAFSLMTYDSIGFTGKAILSDHLYADLSGQYWIYDDDNSIFFASGDLFYNFNPELGLWFGVQGSVTSASKDNDYYWAPYWDQRIDFVLRYRKEYAGFFFDLDAILSIQREDGRDNDSLSTPTDWERGYGFSGTLRKRFWNHLDFFIDARTMFLHSYGDHSFRIGGTYNF